MRIKLMLLVFVLGAATQLAGEIPMLSQDDPKVAHALQLIKEEKYAAAHQQLLTCLEDYPIDEHPHDHLEIQFQIGKVLVHQYQIEAAKRQYQLVVNEARKRNMAEMQSYGYSAMYVISRFGSDYDAMNAYADSLLLLDDIPTEMVSEAYTIRANYYNNVGQVDSMLIYAHKSYTLDVELKDTSSLVFTTVNLGVAHHQLGNRDSALHYYLVSVELGEAIDREFAVSDTYTRISALFRDMNNLHKSREYANAALVAAENVGHRRLYNLVLLQIAELDELENDHTSAIHHYEIAAVHFDTINDIARLSQCHLGLISSYIEIGKIDEAKELITVVERNTAGIDLKRYTVNLSLIKAKAALYDGLYDEAIDILDTASSLIKTYPDIFRKVILFKLYARAYKASGQFKDALSYTEKYHALSDSIQTLSQSFIVNDLEAKYQKAQQEQQIQSLKSTTTELGDRLTKRNRLIGTILILLFFSVLLAFLTFRLYRRIKSKNQIISDALDEKETLLKEVHHRVKNNLQIISSLLSLQARSISDEKAKEALKESQNRVRSMALIHQNLYQKEDFVAVNVQDYLNNMVDELMNTYGSHDKRIEVHKEVAPLELDLDTIIPLGLVINELITNALKYAFKDRDKGKISIQLLREPDRLKFLLKDDGIGLPEDLDFQKSKSLGFRLVRSFCKKMEARLNIESDHGTTVEMHIPFND